MTIQEILDNLPRKSIYGGSGYNEGLAYAEDDKDGYYMEVDAAIEAIKQAWNSALDLAAQNSYVMGADDEELVSVKSILNLKIK